MKTSRGTCTVEGCERPEHGRGFCGTHWYRWNRYGDPLGGGPKRAPAPEQCTVEDCDRKPRARGLCNRHYKADRLANDPQWRDRKNAAWRDWADRNREERRDYQRRYQMEHAEEIAERMQRWRAENTPSLLVSSWVRRRRQYGLPEDVVEVVDPGVVFDRDGGVCQLCDGLIDPELRFPDPMAGTVDHVIPVCDPESAHSYANVVLAHHNCNQRKNRTRVPLAVPIVPQQIAAVTSGGDTP